LLRLEVHRGGGRCPAGADHRASGPPKLKATGTG